MPRYAMLVQYDGTNYVGYQIQKNGYAVQAEIQKALRKIAKLPVEESINIVGSGRTDSGVHALGQVIHFDYPSDIHPNSLLKALNSMMNASVNVRAVKRVGDDFHARYDAIGKTYLYRVDLGQFPDPFKRHYTLHHPYKVNISRIEDAMNAIVGTHDFTSFCSTKTDKTNKVRTIYNATVKYDPILNELHFTFSGNGFLYNMVRILVGTLLQIGDGLKPIDEMARLLNINNRKDAGPTAPPQGLYLKKVHYANSIFDLVDDTSSII